MTSAVPSGRTVAVVLPPKEGFSPGAVGAVGLLVHRLVRAGAPGVVVGRDPGGPPFPDAPFLRAAPAWGLGATARYARGVAARLRRLGPDPAPELAEVHNRPDVALRLCRLLPGTPVSLFLHNDPQGMRGARSPAERGALLARLARVVTASDWLRRRLLDGVSPAPTRPPAVLPNCLDLPAEAPPASAREPVILYAGRLVADKGADLFVEACAAALPHLPGWRAEMIGADRFGPDSPETPFLRALRPRAAAAGVVLRGYRPHDAVMAAMARAAIVAVPSRWEEPFGLAALEAMACGAALVCSPRGGLPEVAGDAALYADPARPGALADALLALARDPALRAALGEAGRARARAFCAPRAARALLALRGEILGPGPPGRGSSG